MPTYLAPGVYMEEISKGVKPIEGVSTSVAAFIGVAERGPVGKATFISNFAEFVKCFGGPIKIIKGSQEHYLYYAVRNFFTQAGTKCYVVRVIHYDDVDDKSTKQGGAASYGFDGIDIDGTLVSPALTVSAINEGKWGENLEVQVENSSKYSLLLGENITAANVKEISLKDNSEVQIGDLLWIVKEATGEVESVSGTNGITFKSKITSYGIIFAGAISAGTRVFTPDFKLITNLSGAVTVTNGDPQATITLVDVENVDGVSLKNGDLINFAVNEALVIVKKISSKTLTSGEKVMVVEFDPRNFTAFDLRYSRVYARDFTIKVKEGDNLLETHENLSLIETNMKDYVEERLSHESGNSFYIAAERSDPAAVLPDNTPFEKLTNGDDGLNGLNDADYIGSELLNTGLYALDKVKDASILVIPGANDIVSGQAITYCENRKDLFFIIDPPEGKTKAQIETYRNSNLTSTSYAAIYYPWIKISDPFTGRSVNVPTSGAVAGIYADTDAKRGVHKAPAGIESGYMNAAVGIERFVTMGENDSLYQEEINVIRKFPEGIIVWGARTLSQEAEWKYINVRRLFIFLEQSIERGTQWVVFEPNDPMLWKSIKRNVSAFLKIQWMEGKLVGSKQEEAFYVKCDEEINPPEIVDAGQVIVEIGVAPVKPAEFVIFRIRQYAGGSAGA